MSYSRRTIILVLGLLLISEGLLAQSDRTKRPSRSNNRGLGGPPPEDRKPVPSTSSTGTNANSGIEDEIMLKADLVTVVVTVTGADGNFISDLRREDFEILEDNSPQEITSFSREDTIPLSLALLFDTSGSVVSRRDFEKEAAINFLRHVLRPQDRAAVFTINTDVTLEVPLTNKVETIVDTIKHVRVEKGATALYDAVYTAAEYLNAADGRRVLVILSDGRDNVSTVDLKKALTRAQQTDAIIYAIHSFGRNVSANLRDPGAEQIMISLAEQTGGDTYFSERVEDLAQNFRRFASELHAQYVLTYYSKNEARDGSFRRLAVKVKRPGVRARTRKGYYAPKERAG